MNASAQSAEISSASSADWGSYPELRALDRTSDGSDSGSQSYFSDAVKMLQAALKLMGIPGLKGEQIEQINHMRLGLIDDSDLLTGGKLRISEERNQPVLRR